MATNIKTFAKTYCAIGAAIAFLAICQTEVQTGALLKLHTRYKWAFLMVFFAFYAAAGLYVVLRKDFLQTWPAAVQSVLERTSWPRWPGPILILLAFPILWYARWQYYGKGLDAFFRLMWLFWLLVLIQTLGWRMTTRFSWTVSFALALLLDGVAVQIYVALLPVTDYPFSAGWSEASRFYYGSLPFSKSVYGVSLPLSIWHGTRYFLQSIPFLINGLPIWAHRLWQAFLWVGLTGLTSWLMVRRLKLQEWAAALIFSLWFFLYAFQGAIYYHLQVCVIIILLGVSLQHSWRSLIAVILASFWAGMSRLNWYPVPAMLAIAIYVLEKPYCSVRSFWQYAARPVLWGAVGLATALLGQTFYIAISGNNNLEAFGSSLTSALLWYRWFPSATNPIGIIPGIVIVSLPLWILLFAMIRGHGRNLHPVRWLALLAMLLTLFVGGLIVSTKIGGGGDLHNMDAYMVMLALIGLYFLSQRVTPETPASPSFGSPSWPGLALMLLVPVAFAFLRVAAPFHYDPGQASQDLATLRQSVQDYSKTGPVLFIYERQLLTFGLIPHVPVAPDYEVVTLMEMAISGNRPYLTQFYQDLASHRFVAIVAHKQNLNVGTGDFIEENDVWTKLVGAPLLCQYKPILTLDSSDIQVFVPRPKPCPDFPPALGGK
jgi:hypothetical protein